MTEAPTTKRRPHWLPSDVYPFTVRELSLPTGTVAYIDEGEGATMLFIHAGMWSFVWRDVIVRLRDRFRCVAIDFPGFGLAPEHDGAATLEAMSKTVGDLADALDLGPVTLVLHDLGGPVGLGWAGRHPDLVRGLVLANTFAWNPDKPVLRGMLRLLSSRAATAIGTATNLIPRLSATRFGVGRHLSRRDRGAFLGPFLDRSRRTRFHRLLRAPLVETGYLDGVERVVTGPLREVPALTIFGARNDPFRFQDRHAEIFRDHEGLVIHKGNHFPMMDDPDVFAAALVDWENRKRPAI